MIYLLSLHNTNNQIIMIDLKTLIAFDVFENDQRLLILNKNS